MNQKVNRIAFVGLLVLFMLASFGGVGASNRSSDPAYRPTLPPSPITYTVNLPLVLCQTCNTPTATPTARPTLPPLSGTRFPDVPIYPTLTHGTLDPTPSP